MTKKQTTSQLKLEAGKENILALQFYVWIVNFKSLAHMFLFSELLHMKLLNSI